MVAQCAVESGAAMLGVATAGEGRRLRRFGIAEPILVLGPSDPSEVVTAADLGLTLAIGSTASLEATDAAAAAAGRLLECHVKLDTGMHRFGLHERELDEFAGALAAARRIHVTGVFSHFASADEAASEPLLRQAARFERMARTLEEKLGYRLRRHLANSAAALRGSAVDLDMVRAGIAMYGLSPTTEVDPELVPAMSVVSRVRRAFTLAPGDEVSYGGAYRATRHHPAALIPVGYGDGYLRSLSGAGWLRVGQQSAPVLGRVCMDQLVVGLETPAREGDLAGVLGPVGGGPSAGELAQLAGTIHYEVVTSLATRVPRFYCSGGEVLATDDERGLRFA
jgi:alanine racemase